MKIRHAADIMTHPVVTIGGEAKLTEAIKMLLRHHVSGLPVVDPDGRLVGIVTEQDIMNFALSGDAADTSVAEVMTKEVIAFPPQTDIATLINCLGNRHIRRVPIVEGDKVVGVVSRRDILQEILFLYNRY
jgi:CBS domain-containing protein